MYLIHSNFSPRQVGGVESVARWQITMLRRSGIKVHCIYAGSMEEERQVCSDSDYDETVLPIIWRKFGVVITRWGNLKFLKLAGKAEVVVFQEPFPSLWPAIFLCTTLLRKRAIVYIHASPDRGLVINKIYSFLRSIFLAGTELIATSPVLAQQIVREAPFWGRSCDVIPLSLPDSVSFSICKYSPAEPYFLFIGRLADYKGIQVLLKALELVPTITTLIVGVGPKEADVKEWLEGVGSSSNVTFQNKFVSEEEKLELIANAHALLLPSVDRHEAFGIVQLEAMMVGTPIINTQLNNGVNWVAPKDQVALTVAPGSDTELAAAMQLLYSDSALRQRLSRNALVRFETNFQGRLFESRWRDLLLRKVENKN